MSEPAHPAYLAVISGLPVCVFRMEPGNFILGRAPEADFRLDHLEISRRHCRVAWDGRECRVEDLGSQWGTCVEDRAVAAPTLLPSGKTFALGTVVLLFAHGHPPSDQELERLGGRLAGRMAAQPAIFRGQKVERVELAEHLTFGRDKESDVVLNSPAVSRQHAMIRRVDGGFRVFDLKSTAGSFVNGRRFDEHELTIGDRLQIGPFYFHFDGSALDLTRAVPGAAVHARAVSEKIDRRTILDNVTLDIAASRFCGIIGPSGAGKSSLLNALSGQRAAGGGIVLIDGVEVARENQRRNFGFVPQDDIVHLELTIAEALQFAAELRLPRDTPCGEVEKLIAQTLAQLGLSDRETTRVGDLSGGQRKRVSVAVELLARPSVLFLDEPTSGLDPATEFKIMELLRDLADTGCTVICTTHVMENVYLMDQVAVMFSGCLVFNGTPLEAREFFGVTRLAALYDKLETQSAGEWRAQFAEKSLHSKMEFEPREAEKKLEKNRPAALGILLRRQFAILRADWRNAGILLSQPVILAALVAWVSNDASLKLFFAYITTLWFGCSNAAQEIVREIAIYRRERMVGVGRTPYLASKFLFLGAITITQSLLFYVCLQLAAHGLGGNAAWQIAALIGTALAAVGIGALISSLARTLMQAVIIVPLALIPLILFSGYTVPANEMKAAVAFASGFTPAFAAQRCIDVSFLWDKTIDHSSLGDHWTSFRNLNRDHTLRTGEIYDRWDPALLALATLAAWISGSFTLSLIALRAREKI